jgi:uncharacterized protein
MTFTAGTLRELHRIHQQLSDLRERLARGPKQVHAREATITRLEADVAQAKADTKSARVSADQKQLLLKSGEAKIVDLRRKLNACSSNREYQALVEQIAADEMTNSVLSDEILEGLEKVDECQRLIAEAEHNLARGKEELAKVQQGVRDQQGLMAGDVKRLETELKAAEASLPADFRDAYERAVKSRGSDAMAEVDKESCGGCFKNITANMFSELVMNRVVFCKSCGRLLYLPEDRMPVRRGS